MTRENKLALVIGFGLILFVGVLVSDHFSAVKMQDAADLNNATSDLILPTNTAAFSITEIDPDPQPRRPAYVESGLGGNDLPVDGMAGLGDPHRSSAPPQGFVSDDVIRGPDLQRLDQMQPPAAGAPPEQGVTIHHVQAGETLYAIAKKYLGNGNKAGEIAAFNNISDAASIRKGHRLRIPTGGPTQPQVPGFVPAQEPAGDSSVQIPGFRNDAPAPASAKTYTVKSGDLLSTISQKTLGTSKRWKEIAALNPQLDPNNMKVGTVIKLPAR